MKGSQRIIWIKNALLTLTFATLATSTLAAEDTPNTYVEGSITYIYVNGIYENEDFNQFGISGSWVTTLTLRKVFKIKLN